jgi:hypothetical protein
MKRATVLALSLLLFMPLIMMRAAERPNVVIFV